MSHPLKCLPACILVIALGFGCSKEPTVAKAVAIPAVVSAPLEESAEVLASQTKEDENPAPSPSHKSTRKPVYLNSVSKELDDDLSASARMSLEKRMAREPKKKEEGIIIIRGGERSW